jgi:hypothetical protein
MNIDATAPRYHILARQYRLKVSLFVELRSFAGQLVAVCLELLAEFLKFAAASGIFVALCAGQTRLLREYGCRGSLSRQEDQRCGCH